MSFTLTIRREAEFDIDDQLSYYEEKRVGLGHEFLLCIEEALNKLQRNLLVYRKIHKELRRIPIRRFPYRIFYFVNNSNVIVTALFHARKDPRSWNDRA
jgi:plasmid stabilization system protein ParE